MGAADTIWLLQRQRMSTAARLLVTGRDMDSRTLHVQAEDCVWQLIDEETAGEQAERAVPVWLWKIADFLQAAGSWEGTASDLLAAAGLSEPQPNLLTRRLVEHYYTVFAPRGIHYESRRTARARWMIFRCDGCDGNDDETESPSCAAGTAEASSPASSSSLEETSSGENQVSQA